MNKSSLLVKIIYILVTTSHAKCWPFKYWWSALSSKLCKKIRVRPCWRSYISLSRVLFLSRALSHSRSLSCSLSARGVCVVWGKRTEYRGTWKKILRNEIHSKNFSISPLCCRYSFLRLHGKFTYRISKINLEVTAFEICIKQFTKSVKNVSQIFLKSKISKKCKKIAIH